MISVYNNTLEATGFLLATLLLNLTHFLCTTFMHSYVVVLDLPFGVGVCAVLISGSRLDIKMACTNKSSMIFIGN